MIAEEALNRRAAEEALNRRAAETTGEPTGILASEPRGD
jgi:hypothetical protein